MIYLNNKLVPKNRAKISVFDHGFLYGDGIYETLRAYRGVVFKIDEHIERLFRSASMIGLKIPKTHDGIKQAIYKTMTANKQKDAYIRISISRGEGPLGLDPSLCPKPTLVIMSNLLKGYPKHYYQKGMKVAIVRTRRNFRNSLNPKIKSLNFLNNILAKIEAKNRGAFEAVMLNQKGYLAEGTITNIFFVKNNVLHTPGIDVGILDGITRRIILDCARKLKIRTRQGKFRRESLFSAQEVFISNTTLEVLPVSHVDNSAISKPGRITKELHSAYKRHVNNYIKENVPYARNC